MGKSIGLEFKKFDLHIHTPASGDYPDKNVTADEIIEKAQEVGLSAIAITDHQTADFVDRVKSAARKTDLVVFPGVEITCSGGKEGIHIICLFDIDKDTSHVNQFLNRLGIYDKNGKKTICTEHTPGQIIDKLMKYDRSAIIVLAHSHSSKGVLSDMRGEHRKMIFETTRSCLIAAEASNGNFVDEQKTKDRKRVIDILDGTDPNFYKRKMGVYQSSDAHSVDDIGSSFSYFKVDEQITIEDVRQACIDRDVRILQPHEFSISEFPQTVSIEISTGFLEDQTIEFHPGLNSILGAKGSGKSLIIEFLRFCLGQPPLHDDLVFEHDSKLANCLGTYGKVTVVIMDETRKKYKVVREYHPSEGNPVQIIDLDDGGTVSLQVEDLFPVLFLSQNEIIKIAEDKTGKHQREFIDQFFGFRKYQSRLESLNDELEEVDLKFADSLRLYLSKSRVINRKNVITQEIAKIDRQLSDEIFRKYSESELVGRALQKQREFVSARINYLVELDTYYESLSVPEEEYEEIAENPSVKRSKDHSQGALDELISSNSATRVSLAKKLAAIDSEVSAWQNNFVPIKQKYEEYVKKAGGDKIVLSERRKELRSQLTEVERELERVGANVNTLETLGNRRKKILTDLDAVRKQYFGERQSRCQFFTEQSGGSLDISIAESGDTSEFRMNLLKLKRGTYLKDYEIDAIVEQVSPFEFVRSILVYIWHNGDPTKGIPEIAEKSGLSREKLQKLYEYLIVDNTIEALLSILYTSVPQDVPSISYKVGTTFRPLSHLSVGQKATSLLLMALSSGSFPIVIDQPEDSLDLRTIWDDVCLRLRAEKENRQFILTTHNSSVAVASDSDKFTILESDSTSARVVHTGSINKTDIKDEVIQYLEGGATTYEQKRQKYNK